MHHSALLFLFILSGALPQNSIQQFALPPIACPDYFRYQKSGNQYIGKITVFNANTGRTVVEAVLSQRGSSQSSYPGSLSLYEGKTATSDRIKTGLPISYRVDFPNPQIPPKITQITVNGAVICSSSSYPGPSLTITLQHTFETNVQTVYTNFPQPEAPLWPVPVTSTTSRNPFFTRPPTFVQTPRPIPVVTTSARPPVPFPPRQPPQSDVNSECGEEGTNSLLIYDGTIVNRGQFPWLTPIYRKDGSDLKFICGGSLISRRTIVTAAHCFTLYSLTAENVVVHVGRYKLDDYEERGYETKTVINLIINREFSSNRYPDADIALAIMSSSVTYSTLIRPICLWNQPNVNVAGLSGVVAGWGSDRTNKVSPVPKMVDQNIVSELECLKRDGNNNQTSARTICAGNLDGSGPCRGDSGGGLMIKRNGRWVLRGIVSVGQTDANKDCDLYKFVIYCDLAKHLAWIESNIDNVPN